MSAERKWVRKGQIVILTEGEYSDYRVQGTFECLKDFHLPQVAEVFVAEKVKAGVNKYEFDDHFFPWLVENGYAKAIDEVEIHMGYYGEFKPEIH